MLETFDASQMRALNSSILLKLIWRDREISRAEISRLTGMSRSTVSAIVAELMRQGLVTEKGIGISNGGRRPVMLAFNEDAYCVLGIEFTAHALLAGITNLNGKIQKWIQLDCAVAQDPHATLRGLREILRQAQDYAREQARPLLGVGVGLPMPLGTRPQVGEVPLRCYASWKQVPVLEIFREESSIPIYFENDANLGALAELWWGQGSRLKNIAFLKMGAGIGSGLIIDGKILRGAQGFAGELGYTSFNAPELGRNQRFCDLFSRYLSVEQLAEDAGALGMVWADSSLSRQKLCFANLCAAAEHGDFLARHALCKIARGLGFAISNLLHTLNLDAVVLGGSFSAVSEEFLQQVKHTVREQAAWPEIADTPILLSPSGEHQCVIGAATLLLERAMDDLSLFPAPQPELTSQLASYWGSYDHGLRTF